MPHTYVNGFGGSVAWASGTVDVESWSLNINAEALDTTNTGDAGWESNILGAKSFDGSCKVFGEGANAALFIPGTRGSITFNVGTTGKNYVGTVQLTKATIENSAKGVVTYACDFKGTGPLTFNS